MATSRRFDPYAGCSPLRPGAVLEVRFEREEFSTLTRLAREEGIGPAEFLHRLALDRIAASQRQRAS